jgi:C1A family cysteine protease
MAILKILNSGNRKHKVSRVICLITALITCFAMAQSVYAENGVMSDKAADHWSGITREQEKTAQTSAYGHAGMSGGKSAPAGKSVDVSESEYYLTNLGRVTTPVTQGLWGACWAFAAVESAESSILMKKTHGKSADMSEPAISSLPASYPVSYLTIPYFSTRRQTEATAGTQAGEGGVSFRTKFPYQALGLGGTFTMAASQLADEQCFASEKAVPYRYKYGGDTIYMNDTRVAADSAYTDEKFLPLYWKKGARSYDWSVEDSSRTKNSGGYYLSDYSMSSFEAQSEEGIDDIKQRLKKYGAVAIGYRADQSLSDGTYGEYTGAGDFFTYTLPKATSERKKGDPVWCQYNDGSDEDELAPNHGVVIVGWDDNYPKENFQGRKGGEPESDGAWLVKNSWGSYDYLKNVDGADMPNAEKDASWGIPYKTEVTGADGTTSEKEEHSGFFWLSYEDATIQTASNFEIGKKDTAHSSLYQYDYLGFGLMACFDSVDILDENASSGSAANVFTAKKTTKLNSVITYTDHADTRVNVRIYLMDSKDKTPGDGTKAASATVCENDAGYHEIKLKKPVNLIKGQRFAVEIEQPVYNQAGRVESYLLAVEEGISKKFAEENNYPLVEKAVINRGETYVRLGRKWYDLVDKRDAIEESNGSIAGNAMAKAYTGGKVSISAKSAAVSLSDSSGRQLRKSGRFVLTTSKGKKIMTLSGSRFTISPNAKALKKYLPAAPGKSVTFKLKETKAPKGYRRSGTVRKVTVKRSDVPGRITYTVKISGRSSVNISHK